MKNKRTVLSLLIILLAGLIYLAAQALQKKANHHADFSGEWKAKESISMGGNIVCSYAEGDYMLAKTIKITEQANFIIIEVPKASPDSTLAASPEKLIFNGKEIEINRGPKWGKKFTVKLSADRQTMTVNTVIHLMTAKPYHVEVQEQMIVYVTEIWKLSNDGNSISVQATAKSNLFSDERSWKTIFDRAD